jgi:mono/diheme cytochrome c family protein
MKMFNKAAKVAAFAAVAVMAVSGTAFAGGAETYKAKCGACHGADGSKTKMGANEFKALSSADVQKKSDAELTKLTSDGVGKMPAFKSKLSEDEIKAVVAHIRTLKK